jgi:transposase
LSTEEFVYDFSEKLNSEVFEQFIQSLIDQFKKVVLVMDHARYHASHHMQDFYEDNEHLLHVEYFPSYSPELDPTEQVWRKMKKWLSVRVWKSADELKKQLIMGFESDFVMVPIYDYLLP